MLGPFFGQEQTNRCLHFARRQLFGLVVVGQFGRLVRNIVEDAQHKCVHDAHGLAGHISIGMNLLQQLVDVDVVRLTALLLLGSGILSGGYALIGILFSAMRTIFPLGAISGDIRSLMRIEHERGFDRRAKRINVGKKPFGRACGRVSLGPQYAGDCACRQEVDAAKK